MILQAAVASRLEHFRESQDPVLVIGPAAEMEARQLAAFVREDKWDMQSRLLLGLLHWYRRQAMPGEQDQLNLYAAVEVLTPYFLAVTDLSELPKDLLPHLVDHAMDLVFPGVQDAVASSDLQLLGLVIDVSRRILDAAPVEHPDRSGMLSNLNAALRTRFDLAGAQGDLDAAIDVARQAVDVAPIEHPARADMLSNLYTALRTRFDLAGAQGDLDEAIDAARQAVVAARTDYPRRATYLSHLNTALQTRFDRSGEEGDLDEAIDAARQAVDATPADDSDRARCLSNLNTALQTRFNRSGVRTDLDEAIDVGRQAVDATAADHPHWVGCSASLGVALEARFRRFGVEGDLYEAIDVARQAVDATTADHPDRAIALSSLGTALRARFDRFGTEIYLDEAINVGRQAVDATTPTDHPRRATRLSILGAALRARFDRSGALGDVDEAIEVARQAVAAASTDHPARESAPLDILGGALLARFGRSGVLGDVDEAIEVARQAVAAASTDDPRRATYMSNLGGALLARFGRSGVLGDVDEAIEVARQAVAAAPAGAPDQARYLSNLGINLQTRFKSTGARGDLDEAIDAAQQAVDATPADHPTRVMVLAGLGTALETRFGRSGAQLDRDAAIANFEQAVDVVTAGPSLRIRAARSAARLAVPSQPHRAARLLERAVRLLPEVAPRELERADQQYALGGFAWLAADAASLALEDPSTPASERAGLALQLSEAGRTVMLSQALHVRSDLTDLTSQHAGLARRFTHLRDLLDNPSDTTTSAGSIDETGPFLEPDYITRDRRQLVRDLDDILVQIRAQDGFASFALPPSRDELLTQAAHGPVVVFNISTYRSDALLLTTDGITSLPLPDLPLHRVIAQAIAFHQALTTAHHDSVGTERIAAQQRLTKILEWLWDNAAGPVLDKLGYHRPSAPAAAPPRVWWAPGGLMNLLPIHAAGYHTIPPDPQGRTVLDRVVSSYTPTITALGFARQHRSIPLPSGARRALIVAMPTTPGIPGSLTFVRDEAEMLAARLPESVQLTEPKPGALSPTPANELPTKANVVSLLSSCPIAHFSCHGTSDPTDPSLSRLLLHDHSTDPLTVAALAQLHLDDAQLAYLSACATALTTNTELIDEAIHLTAAFQLAGYPHVIGTLWAINDHVAAQIAEEFYTRLTSIESRDTLDVGHAAHALHDAVRAVRGDFPATPSLWGAYLHSGS
ncbi:CHAT domain-containing protein [Nocardia sp. NPDC052278]|uniref:CHAT domain-containing tetratricopeptide repeat protein n=1 Tax=unclassified Nocardia TaxID=2637762 RepID=UPI0036AA3F6F